MTHNFESAYSLSTFPKDPFFLIPKSEGRDWSDLCLHCLHPINCPYNQF